MYSTLIYLAIALTIPSLARAASPEKCAEYLGVPLAYAAPFEKFDLKFVTPLSRVRFEPAEAYRPAQLVLAPEILDAAYEDDRVTVPFHTYDFGKGFEIEIESVSLLDQFEPEVTYMQMIAHFLERYPQTKAVTFVISLSPDIAVVKAGLARGLDAKSAVAATPIFRALAAFGFEPREIAAKRVAKRLLPGYVGQVSSILEMKR